jgi:hypothetical protein
LLVCRIESLLQHLERKLPYADMLSRVSQRLAAIPRVSNVSGCLERSRRVLSREQRDPRSTPRPVGQTEFLTLTPGSVQGAKKDGCPSPTRRPTRGTT